MGCFIFAGEQASEKFQKKFNEPELFIRLSTSSHQLVTESKEVSTQSSRENSVVFKRSVLLSHPAVIHLTVKSDPAYSGKPMQYVAVPVYELFKQIPMSSDASIQFRCLDGFSGLISRERLLNHSSTAAIAYLAIELEKERWPFLNLKSSGSDAKIAGPFYLVWMNPERSQIGREEWPFQLAGFEVEKSMKDAYPAIFPEGRVSKKDPVFRGFYVFTKNCFMCHTFNLQGKSQIGPDLNMPMSPIEYFKKKALKKFIRDPQSLRHWPFSKMKGFSNSELSESELNDLIEYFVHMSQKKRNP